MHWFKWAVCLVMAFGNIYMMTKAHPVETRAVSHVSATLWLIAAVFFL